MHLFAPLQDWQDRTGNSDEETGALIGVSRSMISRAKRGLQPLKMKHQLALQKFTGISPGQWAEFYAGVVVAAAKPQKKSARAEFAA